MRLSKKLLTDVALYWPPQEDLDEFGRMSRQGDPVEVRGRWEDLSLLKIGATMEDKATRSRVANRRFFTETEMEIGGYIAKGSKEDHPGEGIPKSAREIIEVVGIKSFNGTQTLYTVMV